MTENKINSKVRDMVFISAFAALMAICAWISVTAVVPFTMQTFAIFMAAAFLGAKRGTLAVLVYILLGAAGLPVFSGFKGGIGAIMGSTGGYITGFLPCAFITGLLCDRFGRSLKVMIPAMLAGLVICYAIGTGWFMAVYLNAGKETTLYKVLFSCVIPFIIPDTLKICLAAFLTKRLAAHLH